MSERLRRKPRSRRSCCLFSVIGLLLILGGLGAGFAWFYSHPISSATLHERVVRRLERISGLKVAYDSATLTLSTGQYRIANLRFTDPANPALPVLTVGEVFATIHPWQVLSDKEAILTEVVLKNPSQLDLLYSQDSVRLGKRSQFLVDSVSKAQPPGSDKGGQLPFNDLRIENIDLALTEAEGILPGLSGAPAAMVLAGDLEVSNENKGGLAFDFVGNVQRPGESADAGTTPTVASGVAASVLLQGEEVTQLQAQVKSVALAHIFRAMPETTLHCEDLTIDLSSAEKDGLRTLKGSFGAAGLEYLSPENNLQLRDEKVLIKADLDVDTSAGQAIMRSIDLGSQGARAVISGRANYKTQDYDTRISADNLTKDYRVLLERLLPAGWDVQAERNSFAVNMHVGGGASGVTSVDGKVSVRGAHLLTPDLPAALKNLHGDVEFSPEHIKFIDMTGEYAGARVALDGDFKGDLWQARSGAFDINWSTIIPLAEVLQLHGSQLADASEKISGQGSIRGHGTWRQAVDLSNPQQSGAPQVEGEISFHDVGLSYKALPAPIAGLNGTTRIDGERLVINSLTGSMQGNKLDVAGEIAGKTFFWREPEVSASLQSRLDLANIGPYLTSTQQAALQEYQVSGKAETEVLLRGPLAGLASSFTGKLAVTDLAFTPNLDFLQGKFAGVNGSLSWDGKTLKLDDLEGTLEGEPLKLSGDISAQHIDLAINSTPNLNVVEQMFPRLDQYLDMSGTVGCDLTFQSGTEDDAPGTGSLTQMLESARVIADTSVKEQSYKLNGRLEFEDASIRHIAMPPARTERGRKIPAGRITGLNGAVDVVNDTIMVPNGQTLSCAFSDTEKCRVSGSIKFRPDDFPAMKVRINSGGTLRLDTWALGWGKELSKPAKPPITGKKYDLDAEITAPSVVFRGQEAGRSLAKLSFNMVQDDKPRVINFREVVVQGNRPGYGRVIGSGTIESFVWNERDFPRWKTALDVQTMPLETMLAAVFNEPATIRGMITGNMELSGVDTNARSMRGNGSGFMRNLEIGGTAVIRELGQTTGRNFGGMLFETAQAATFEVGNGALSSRDLALATNGLQLDLRGDYWFSGDPARSIAPKTVSGVLRLRLFKSVFGSIPIIGQVADLADEVTNAFLLAFRVSGTADNPRVTPVAMPVFQGAA